MVQSASSLSLPSLIPERTFAIPTSNGTLLSVALSTGRTSVDGATVALVSVKTGCCGVTRSLLGNDQLTGMNFDHRKQWFAYNKKRCSDKGFLAMAEADYQAATKYVLAIFERLGIDAGAWSETVKEFGRVFKDVAGKSTSIEQARSLKTRRKFYQARV